jgi:hypothetical protein
MTDTQQFTPTRTRPARAPGVVRTRLRGLHLAAGSLLGAYPYLPDTVPGHGLLRWSLMTLVIPAVTASGLWLWKQAAVRRWLRGADRMRR